MKHIINFSIFRSRWSNWSTSSHSPIGEFLLLLSWFKNLETAHQCVINRHHGTCIVELTTIVRSAKKCYQLPLCKEFVPILNDLVGSTYQINIMLFVES